MAYKPKYAQRKEAQTAHTAPEAPQSAPRKKPGKLRIALLSVVGVFLIPAALYATFLLLTGIYENVGRPKPAAQKPVADMAIAEQFSSMVSEEITDTLNILLAVDTSGVPEETIEVEPVRKRYWIEEGTLVAPEPNPACYGETTDPGSLQWLLDEAKWILEGQNLFFNLNVELFQGSTVKYYLDDSIFAITWKEVHDGSVYTFSEVKVSHPSQFRRHLAGGEYGSDYQYKTTEMAESVNAVVASSGDFYRFRDFGAVVYQGEAKRVEGTYAETCYIDSKGNMHFTYAGEVLTTAAVQEFVDEHDIQFSLAFGPILVDNYEIVEHTWYGVGEITEGYARAALAQLGELHYIVATANTEGPYQEIPTVAMFQKNIAATGCRMAYCLDGGQTAAIVMNDQLINRPVYGEQRKISDIIYFATAVPDGGQDNG